MMRTQNFIRPEQPRPTIITGRSDQPQPFIVRQEPSRPTIMRSEPPRPTFMRSEPPRPTMMRSEPPRPTVMRSEQPRPTMTMMQSEAPRPTMMRSEPPRPMMTMRSQNPFMNLMRAQGPIMIRSQNIPMIPQTMSEISPRPMNMSPPQPSQEGPIVTKENPNGPTIIGFSLPQLLSRVNSMIPRMEQAAGPRVMEISMRNPFRDFQRPSMSLPEMPRMVEGLFGRKDDDIEPFLEETLFGDDDEDTEDFIQESLFGRKDDDIEPFGGFEGLFEQINNHMGRLMSAMPQQLGGMRGMIPFGQPTELGKLTVIKAGPGFHEEKHFDIGPNGKLTEVEPIQMHDALEHANPMDTHFNSNDVEVFHDEDEDIAKINDSEVSEVEREKVENEPVMDVRGLEEQEPELPKAQVIQSVEDFGAKEYPFLSVLRNTVEENERISQQILSKYRAMAEEEYLDDNSCSSHHLKWSDWVACLHAKVGVPRWLTAATISLGIVFSVWLCLVIPSSAPKQRLRALVIKAEKPSAAVAKAKEAEAAASAANAAAKAKEAEAAGYDAKDYVVAVVNVDMPPTYGDCGATPGSPAPSYKSDMAAPAVPGSPAPSYRSVDIPVEKEEKEEKVDLEPVHEKKESVA
eukprot:TRINITY_DN1860_c0_g1_i11.p1 TRINITY_DN1860_c0_g1~~TRINITY_DN1860_c0_g1_i11.p1  ORF type:complete len:690 (-),score=217.93 TRINITY_DN1860_c0_g1_i11:431-2314(-)